MGFKKFLEEDPTITTTSVGDASVEGGQANFAKKFGNIFKRVEHSKHTSESNGHIHEYYIDPEGNGRTDVKDKHFHEIVDLKVQETKGHTHTI